MSPTMLHEQIVFPRLIFRRLPLVAVALLGTMLCFPMGVVRAQKTTVPPGGASGIKNSDGSSITTNESNGQITIVLPKTGTTVTVDPKNGNPSVGENDGVGGNTSAKTSANPDGSSEVTINNGLGTDILTIKQETNSETGEITTTVTTPDNPNVSASVTTDKKGNVVKAGINISGPSGQSYLVSYGPDGQTHIYSRNQRGETVSDTTVGAGNSVVLGADGIPHVDVPPPPPPPPATPQDVTSGVFGTPKVELRAIGGASLLNGNAASAAGFDGAVLFPLGNRVDAGPVAGYERVNNALISTIGGGPAPSTFIKESAGFKDANFGGEFGVNLGRWTIGVNGGATVANAAITQNEGFCSSGSTSDPSSSPTSSSFTSTSSTAVCTVENSKTTHDTIVEPFVGAYISHSISSHLGVFVEGDYCPRKVNNVYVGNGGVVAGLILSFGRHNAK